MPTTYDELIDRVQRPARYVGGELHSIVKDWDAPGAPEVRVALAYPDLYDLGMSNLGLGILYDIVNRREDALAERVFSPWTDFEDLLRAHGEVLRSLETRHALHEFDLLGISLSYEVCFTNVLNLLELGGIPIRSADRAEHHPIVLGGGSAALEPEPMAPFFDAFALGEGEELIDELVDFVRDWKRAGRGSRHELHRALAALDGVYVPSLYEASYRPDGTLEATRPIDEAAPATLSGAVVARAIRGAIGFEGLLISDDLCMNALSGSPGARARAALEAGCDAVLHCNGDLAEMRRTMAGVGRMTCPAMSRFRRGAALARGEAPRAAAGAGG